MCRNLKSKKIKHCSGTVFSVGVEGGQLWLCLLDDLLSVHALLQTLEHALLSDSLDIPPENITEQLQIQNVQTTGGKVRNTKGDTKTDSGC